MKNNQRDIEKFLRQLGATGIYKGFKYLSFAITKCINDPQIITYICKGVYVDIAFRFDVSVYSVERDIRTVKNVIFERGNLELIQEVFGDILIGRKQLTNAEFIDGIIAYLQENKLIF